MPDTPIPSADDLQTNPIRTDLKPIPSTMKVEGIDPARLKELQDQIAEFSRTISLSSSEEKAALKREIERYSLHLDLTELMSGKRPIGQTTKYAIWTAVGGGIGVISTLLAGC